MRSVALILMFLPLVGCSRFDETKPVHDHTQIDDYSPADDGATPEKPFGPIFSDGYVKDTD